MLTAAWENPGSVQKAFHLELTLIFGALTTTPVCNNNTAIPKFKSVMTTRKYDGARCMSK